MAFLEILVRKCVGFVFLPRPLFSAQGISCSTNAVFFQKCHLLSSLHRPKSAGRGLGCSMATPSEGAGPVACGHASTKGRMGFSCPSSTAWHLWVLPLCTHPALPTPHTEAWNVKHSIKHPVWQLSPARQYYPILVLFPSFLLGQLPVHWGQ